jgi:hypothetical protein
VENCPFCGEEVDEDLIIYGGACPSCFAEIPGEEAPTNPGEEVIAQQVEADRRQAGIRFWMSAVAIALFLLVLSGGALFTFLQPEPEIVVMDFDEFDDWEEPTIVADPQLVPGEPETASEAAPAPAPAPGARAASQPQPQPQPQPRAGGLDGVAVVAPIPTTRKRPGAGSVPTPAGPSSGPALGRDGSAGGLGFSGVEVTQNRRGEALDDPDAIRKSVGENMKRQIPRLTACYDQRLKTAPNLQGRWRIKFTVTPDGRVKDAASEGLQAKDGEFEDCLAREVAKWKFDRMVREQPVQRTLRF